MLSRILAEKEGRKEDKRKGKKRTRSKSAVAYWFCWICCAHRFTTRPRSRHIDSWAIMKRVRHVFSTIEVNCVVPMKIRILLPQQVKSVFSIENTWKLTDFWRFQAIALNCSETENHLNDKPLRRFREQSCITTIRQKSENSPNLRTRKRSEFPRVKWIELSVRKALREINSKLIQGNEARHSHFHTPGNLLSWKMGNSSADETSPLNGAVDVTVVSAWPPASDGPNYFHAKCLNLYTARKFILAPH